MRRRVITGDLLRCEPCARGSRTLVRSPLTLRLAPRISPVLTRRSGVRYFGGFPEIRVGKEGVRISD